MDNFYPEKKMFQEYVKLLIQREEAAPVDSLIEKGGVPPKDDDHRLTLRMPNWLLGKIDTERKERVGTISRNLWILEAIEKVTKEAK